MADGLEQSMAYRQALGRLATGVVAITTEAQQGAWGITVNSLVSASLNPRLILWLLDHGSDRYAVFAGAPAFGASVLRADQQNLSARFAMPGCPPADVTMLTRLSGAGAPVLKDALARFDCRVQERHHIGDHLLIVGEVTAFDTSEGDGLLYFRSRYGRAAMPEV